MDKKEQLKRIITFKQNEKDLFEFLKTKRNVSVYIKDLIEADMKGISLSVTKNALRNIPDAKEDNNLSYDDF